MAKKAGMISIDFTKEESSGGARVRVPEGDYRVKVKSVKPDSSNAGNPMLVWEFTGVEGKLKGKTLRDYTALTPKALWKVRSIFEAIGVEVEGKSLNFKPAQVVGKELGVTVEDDEYEGKISSKINDYIDLETLAGSDVGDPDDEDDETVEDDDTEADEEDEDGEDDLDDLDRAELKKLIKSEELDITVKKSWTDDDIRDAIREARSEGGDGDDEELEELDLESL